MYSSLITALKATGIPFAEHAWNNAPQTGSYGVIALDTEADAMWGDDGQLEQAFQGTVDLFCRSSDRTDFGLVQGVLKAQGVSWQLNSIQHERENRLIHYEWVFEIEVL